MDGEIIEDYPDYCLNSENRKKLEKEIWKKYI